MCYAVAQVGQSGGGRRFRGIYYCTCNRIAGGDPSTLRKVRNARVFGKLCQCRFLLALRAAVLATSTRSSNINSLRGACFVSARGFGTRLVGVRVLYHHSVVEIPSCRWPNAVLQPCGLINVIKHSRAPIVRRYASCCRHAPNAKLYRTHHQRMVDRHAHKLPYTLVYSSGYGLRESGAKPISLS